MKIENSTYKIKDSHMVGITISITLFVVGVWELMKTYLPVLFPVNAVYYPMEWIFDVVIVIIGIIIMALAVYDFMKFNRR